MNYTSNSYLKQNKSLQCGKKENRQMVITSYCEVDGGGIEIAP